MIYLQGNTTAKPHLRQSIYTLINERQMGKTGPTWEVGASGRGEGKWRR
jgi:hypothetical protein